jgi:DNA-binding winged helix-turn-helix (wHTH) protein
MPLRFTDFVFDQERRQLLRGEEEIHLEPRTFRVLEVLLDHRPRAVEKRELMKAIWPDVVVEESNLKTAISELRAALNAPDLIRTVHRYGYAFAGDVTTTDASRPAAYRLYGDDLHVSVSTEEAIIGRHPSCEVWLDSTDISRQHARIRMRSGEIVIEDLGSKNGTWVGDKKITGPTALHDGDRIRIADVTLIFRAPSSDESTKSRTEARK